MLDERANGLNWRHRDVVAQALLCAAPDAQGYGEDTKTEWAACQLPKFRFACVAHVSESCSVALFRAQRFWLTRDRAWPRSVNSISAWSTQWSTSISRN